jgi:hypothetical protein
MIKGMRVPPGNRAAFVAPISASSCRFAESDSAAVDLVGAAIAPSLQDTMGRTGRREWNRVAIDRAFVVQGSVYRGDYRQDLPSLGACRLGLQRICSTPGNDRRECRAPGGVEGAETCGKPKKIGARMGAASFLPRCATGPSLGPAFGCSQNRHAAFERFPQLFARTYQRFAHQP